MTKFLLLFCLSSAALVYGQTAFTAHDGEEHALAPLQGNRGGWIFMPLTDEPNLTCGIYFILAGGKPTLPDGKPAQVFFMLKGEQGLVSLIRVGRDQIVVFSSDNMAKPTATYVTPGIGEHFRSHWMIRISRQDYRVARSCLPDAVPQVQQ
jgi:hypothetical protein